MVQWLIENGEASNSEQAVILGQALLENGIIHHGEPTDRLRLATELATETAMCAEMAICAETAATEIAMCAETACVGVCRGHGSLPKRTSNIYSQLTT